MFTSQPTQQDTDTYRDTLRARHEGEPFAINSNGPGGVHVRCTLCGESASQPTATSIFLGEHLRRCERAGK